MIPSKDKAQSFRCAELLSFNHIWALSIVNICSSETRSECNECCKVTQLQIPTYFHLSFTFMTSKGHYNLFLFRNLVLMSLKFKESSSL